MSAPSIHFNGTGWRPLLSFHTHTIIQVNKDTIYIKISINFALSLCVVKWEKVSPAGISCIYSTKHNSAIIQFQSKFDIYILFVPFCMHAPFCWHNINEEWVGATLIHFNGTSWWPLLLFHNTTIIQSTIIVALNLCVAHA